MRSTRALNIVAALLFLGFAVTSVGWFRSSQLDARDQPSQSERFDACHVEGGIAVLDYLYGVNEKVTITADSRGEDGIVVSFEEQEGGGDTIALGLRGQFRIVVGGEGGEHSLPDLRYPDGTRLTCTSS